MIMVFTLLMTIKDNVVMMVAMVVMVVVVLRRKITLFSPVHIDTVLRGDGIGIGDETNKLARVRVVRSTRHQGHPSRPGMDRAVVR